MMDGPRLPPKSGKKPESLIVFLHGYGADGNDLIDLGREWQALLPDTAFVSPNAPEPCGMSPMGRQWFPLTMRDPNERWRGVNHAEASLNAFLDAELARLGLDDASLALVGFSQGTMMALHVGLRRTSPVAGIVGFSGVLVTEPGKATTTYKSKPPILLVHGDRDEVIPVQALALSREALGTAGIPCEWHISQGIGHGIDGEGLRQGGAFLANHLR